MRSKKKSQKANTREEHLLNPLGGRSVTQPNGEREDSIQSAPSCKREFHFSIPVFIILLSVAFFLGVIATLIYQKLVAQNPATDTDVAITATSVQPEMTQTLEDLFKEQNENFVEVTSCQPRAEIWTIADLLDNTDDLLDKSFRPEKIAVNQCSDVTSYCPGGKICKPTDNGQKDKEIFLKVVSRGNSSPETDIVKRVAQNIKEHSKCTCQDD